jgi:hypothetical protein
MGIAYAWRGDERYYATVVDRYYRQAPLPLHLGIQATIFWVVTSGLALYSDFDLSAKSVWLVASAVFGLAIPHLVKRGVVLKYRLRPTFGTETTFRMTDTEVVVGGPGAGRFPWTVYDRAVSFPDGLLLVRRGGIRWLPHAALREGTPADALAAVQSHLPIRVLNT